MIYDSVITLVVNGPETVDTLMSILIQSMTSFNMP